jgi:hypothetical protein
MAQNQTQAGGGENRSGEPREVTITVIASLIILLVFVAVALFS